MRCDAERLLELLRERVLCVAVRVCFTCRRSSAGVCGVVEGEGVGQVGVLLMLHSDQNFQGTPERPDS